MNVVDVCGMWGVGIKNLVRVITPGLFVGIVGYLVGSDGSMGSLI
jgi:hypothetical protein